MPPATRDQLPECACCGHAFAPPTRGSFDAALANALAASLLLLPPFLSPLMTITSFGISRPDWLPSGVRAMWEDGFQLLAALVFLFSIAIPFVYLALMVWVLGSLRAGITRSVGRIYRYAGWLRPWLMIEVYLVGCCVAYTRLETVGNVSIGVGGWCLIGACLAWLLLALKLDARMVWEALPSRPDVDPSKASVSCGTCELLLDVRYDNAACPRCGARVRARKPDSIRRTTALILTGYLLYLPANIIPVLSIERFGKSEPNTILGGVHELIVNQLWPLAIVVFTASVLVPLMKLFGLSFMLIMTWMRSQRWLVGRTRLYRLIDLIGRWSNIDLFMISLLVAMVQFGTLTTIRPQPGAIAFAAVVVVTMVASRCFDTRLMWDAAEG
ncbi:MAG TPA: paraquat-inducible protein A [Chloroflexota bacterium]|nr:paraquat-inducible protein A [Chloroflexota bacterium]